MNRNREQDEEGARRLLLLLGYLAFAIEEAEKLGHPKAAIKIGRARLQLCFEWRRPETSQSI
jgi:hypothetical protein